VNGQIERFHSTFLEIYRCLKQQHSSFSIDELVSISVDRYNNSIHSVTKRKPVDIFFNRCTSIDLQKMVELRQKKHEDIRGLLQRSQEVSNHNKNRNRSAPKTYQAGQEVFVVNKQIKSKDKRRFNKETVDQDRVVTVKTRSGKILHKSHLKN